MTVAGILASAGIDASAAIAKSFKVDPLFPRNGQTRINLRFEDQYVENTNKERIAARAM